VPNHRWLTNWSARSTFRCPGVIAAIARQAEIIVPDATTEILPGDEIIAVTHRTEEDALRHLLITD
jgi:Trk K+ transport system NAD-binding subunit